jgi:hypothetical protein
MRLMDAGIEAFQGQGEVDRVDIIEVTTSANETRERRGGDQDGRIQCLAGRHHRFRGNREANRPMRRAAARDAPKRPILAVSSLLKTAV